MEELATIVPPLQLKKGLDRQLFVPTPDQEGFQKLEINEDFEDADVDKLESLVYPKGARQTGVGQHYQANQQRKKNEMIEALTDRIDKYVNSDFEMVAESSMKPFTNLHNLHR
jgi:hypothetical protein